MWPPNRKYQLGELISDFLTLIPLSAVFSLVVGWNQVLCLMASVPYVVTTPLFRKEYIHSPAQLLPHSPFSILVAFTRSFFVQDSLVASPQGVMVGKFSISNCNVKTCCSVLQDCFKISKLLVLNIALGNLSNLFLVYFSQAYYSYFVDGGPETQRS